MIVKCIRHSTYKFKFSCPPNIITDKKQIDIYITWKGLVPFADLIKNHNSFVDKMGGYYRSFRYNGETLTEGWVNKAGEVEERKIEILQKDIEDFLPVIQQTIDKYFIELETEIEKKKMSISCGQKQRYEKQKKGK